MRTAITLGAAQSRLLCLLDDATRRICADDSVGVVLSGSARDAAVLGLVSLYKTDPVHSYAVAGNTLAHSAAVRFGALHQTCEVHGVDSVFELAALATKDGLRLINGAETGPGPFADPAVVSFFAQLPDCVDRNHLLALALAPLLGEVLARASEDL